MGATNHSWLADALESRFGVKEVKMYSYESAGFEILKFLFINKQIYSYFYTNALTLYVVLDLTSFRYHYHESFLVW